MRNMMHTTQKKKINYEFLAHFVLWVEGKQKKKKIQKEETKIQLFVFQDITFWSTTLKTYSINRLFNLMI